MKKFVLIYHGNETPTPELLDAWNAWYQKRSASFADIGNAFGPGRQITQDTTIELSVSSNPASGYSIVNAEHIDAAEQLLEGCPIIDSVSLYEALPRDPALHPNSSIALGQTANRHRAKPLGQINARKTP